MDRRTIEREDLGGGVVALRFDRKDKPHNIIDMAAVRELAGLVEAVLADEAVRGVVLCSAKPSFIVGGDITEIVQVASPIQALDLVSLNRHCLRRIETGGKPFVATINGLALGGGLELAMACHRRLAAEDAPVMLGLPEVTLGMMPGAGGTQRLPRLVGMKAGLDMLLDGKPVDARKARALGLVDDLAPAAELVARAKALILEGKVAPVQPWDDPKAPRPALHPQSPEGRQLLGGLWVRLTARGANNDPAPGAIVQAVHHGLERGMDAGLEIEQRHFARIVAGPVAKNKIRTLFLGMQAVKAMPGRPAGAPPYPVGRVGVIGAGLMGSGIAHASARAGLDVVLLDISAEAAAKGKASIAKACARAVERGRLKPAEAEAILARIAPTADYADFAAVDLVVEAVSEVRAIKDAVIARASEAVRPGVPIASNTSTMPISDLAEAAARPGDFIGLHFFAPVDRMEFVEVIRGRRTTDATLARALDYMKAIRKTVVVVNDGTGFYTSRVVAAYTGEALTLLSEGVPPALVDNIALKAGMPIGPLLMADATSLRLLLDIFGSIEGDGSRIGLQGMHASDTLARLVEAGRAGKAAGGGIYDYSEAGARVWPGLAGLFPPAGPQPDAETIRKRLIYAQGLEAARALEEGIVASRTDADVASVLAWAFPAHLGGVLSLIETVGVPAFVAECRDLAARFGARFTPPALLERMARDGTGFDGVPAQARAS